MKASLLATVGPLAPPRQESPAAFTRWMLHHLVGNTEKPVGLHVLADGIAGSLAIAESAQALESNVLEDEISRSVLAEELNARIARSSSPFTVELRGRGWTDASIVDELISLSLAGWESTAAAVTSGITIGLSTDPTKAEVEELLRLYPPSWLIVRETPVIEEWGAPGDVLVVSPWLSHRSQTWADPETFDPNRVNNGAALPFGAGPRRCPADLYAHRQIKVALGVFGGKTAEHGRPELLNHRSATLVPNAETR